MTQQIHGHEVIAMITASNRSYTKDSLCAAIVAQFGPETRFHTCSAENMDAGQMVDFFASRGKFIAKDDGFTIDPATVGQH